VRHTFYGMDSHTTIHVYAHGDQELKLLITLVQKTLVSDLYQVYS